MKNIFELTYLVKQEDIDDLNHVNNLKYLEWALMVSGKHWEIIADEKVKTDFYWVVARHEIDYFKPAFLGDEITIQTWIESMKKASSIRVIEMYKNNNLITRVKTTWVLIDGKTHKVSRIPQDFQKFIRTR